MRELSDLKNFWVKKNIITQEISSANGALVIGYGEDEVYIDFAPLQISNEERRELLEKARIDIVTKADKLYPDTPHDEVLVWLVAKNEIEETVYASCNYGYYDEAERGIESKAGEKGRYYFADFISEIKEKVLVSEAQLKAVQEEKEIAISEIKLALTGTLLEPVITKVPELYGEGNPKVKSDDPNYGKHMYVGVLQVGNHELPNTKTVTSYNMAEVRKELLDISKKYAKVRLAMMSGDDSNFSRKIDYLAVGELNMHQQFTGTVYSKKRNGTAVKEYMVDGKYLPKETKDNEPLSNRNKEEIFKFIVSDKDFHNRCKDIADIYVDTTDELRYTLKLGLEDKHIPHKMAYHKTEPWRFDAPTLGAVINTNFPEEKYHNSKTMLSRTNFFKIATNYIENERSFKMATLHLSVTPIKQVLDADIYIELIDVIAEGIEAKAKREELAKVNSSTQKEQPKGKTL